MWKNQHFQANSAALTLINKFYNPGPLFQLTALCLALCFLPICQLQQLLKASKHLYKRLVSNIFHFKKSFVFRCQLKRKISICNNHQCWQWQGLIPQKRINSLYFFFFYSNGHTVYRPNGEINTFGAFKLCSLWTVQLGPVEETNFHVRWAQRANTKHEVMRCVISFYSRNLTQDLNASFY